MGTLVMAVGIPNRRMLTLILTPSKQVALKVAQIRPNRNLQGSVHDTQTKTRPLTCLKAVMFGRIAFMECSLHGPKHGPWYPSSEAFGKRPATFGKGWPFKAPFDEASLLRGFNSTDKKGQLSKLLHDRNPRFRFANPPVCGS